ncbi:MAG: thiamine pyrophosphate-binding protein [Candidatus Liptonbacteria bacterium]|nr:thiamine pyrophosphate-binding protein [Candidatus Liptonbacteria bacterium]
MKVADFIINYLADYGIKEVFVVYGAANGDLIDAFTRNDKIRYVAVMHEQAGGFAAEGYAKISGKPGVAIATSGPGGMNFVTPIGNCFYDSVPALFITGQINSQFMRPDPAIRQVGFQETDIVGIVKPIVKYAKMITNPADVKYELEKSLFLAQDGRPGPVLLDIPLNVQKMDIDAATLEGFNPVSWKMSYDVAAIDAAIDEYLKDLSKAKRPVLMIGAGVRTAGAIDLLLEIGLKLKIPLFPTWNALDIVTSDYEFYGGRIGTYGGRGRNFGLQNSDLVLAVGSRISGRITGGNLKTFLRAARKYVVDVDETLLQKKLQQVPFDVNIHSDAKLFLERFLKKLGTYHAPDFSPWTKKVMEWRDKYDPVRPEFYKQKKYANPYVFMRVLSEEMKEGDILVGDCGGNIVISNHAFETKKGQRNITNNGNSPMGFSHSAVMGAWLASDKKHNVVCTIGDGGFNMNIQELQTFKNYNIKAKTFIINNHIYGITKAFQETNFQGRMEACGPIGYNPPDFVKICNAYGVKTVVINDNSEIKEKIKEVLEYNDGPIVCDVNCHEWHEYSPRIFGWKTPIEDMYPYLPREEFKANMMIEPVEGWENPAMPDVVKKQNTME